LDSNSKSSIGDFMIFSRIKRQVQKITFNLFWLIVFVMSFYVFSAEAQNKKSNAINFDNCEMMVLKLANAAHYFVKDAKPDSYLIIIGGSMKGEKSSYNSRRIQESIGYINWGAKTKNDRIIFGIGIPETDFGYLRFYVNGVLSQEIKTAKNAKLCFGEGNEFNFKRN
jgi:hypothetical protein